MILSYVFERFISDSPLTVMLRTLLEQSLPAEEVDALFEQQAQRQYHRELLFSTVVTLMSLVVMWHQPVYQCSVSIESERDRGPHSIGIQQA